MVVFDREGGFLDDYAFIEDGGKVYGFGDRGRVLELETLNDATISGRTAVEAPQKLGGTPYQYDLTFSAEIIPARQPGEPLPADGGEPGAAYMAFIKASQEGNLEEYVKHAKAERAAFLKQFLAMATADMLQWQADPIKSSAPTEMSVSGGELFGDWAILEVAGKDSDGDAIEGKVKMVKDGETWRLAEEDVE
jgi:hypothetical protein